MKLKQWVITFMHNHPKLVRLGKFILATFVIYVAVKAPMLVFFTDVLKMHYVISGFIVGSIMSLLNFLPSEFWVWRKKK